MQGIPLVTQSDIEYLQSVHTALNLRPPTSQMNQALMYYFKGYPAHQAAKAAGYASGDPLNKFLRSEEGKVITNYIRDQHMQDINITRELLTTMLLEAHNKAATSTEEIMSIRELGKLHDLYPGTKAGVQVNIAAKIENSKQLAKLSKEELFELAGSDMAALLAEPEPIEGELVDERTDEEKELDL